MQVPEKVNLWLNQAKENEQLLKRIVIGIGIIILISQWVRITISPGGGFDLHHLSATRMVNHEFIYENGHNYPYPPFWAMAHIPFTAMEMHPAQVLIYPVFLLSLLSLLWIVREMSKQNYPLSQSAQFWVSVVAVILTSRFLLRDMVECGANLVIVTLPWFALFLWQKRYDKWAGVILGYSIALKCTPALFCAYFIWKREWKIVKITAIATLLFTLSPMLILGPSEYVRAGKYWAKHAVKGISESDPSMGVLGEVRFQNISLRPSLARFMMVLPEGHAGRVDDPLYYDFLDLKPETANSIIKVIMILMIIGAAWITRGKIESRDDPKLVWEFASISLYMLLLSPITWGQHCVGVLPICYLITRKYVSEGKLSRWMIGILAAYTGMILVLNRELIGQKLSWLLDSYHLHTWSLIGLLIIAVGCHRQASKKKSLDVTETIPDSKAAA